MTEPTEEPIHPDSDLDKGAVESDRPGSPAAHPSEESMSGQLGHRDPNASLKENDTDFPEPDAPGEHSGETA